MKFNDSWCNKFKFILKFGKSEGFAVCTVCGRDFSVGHGGEIDINRHKDTSKHKGCVDATQRQRKLTDFGASSVTTNLDQKVVKAEVLFSGFLVEHNQITHMLSEQITSDLKEQLLLTRWYGFATDGSSDEDEKCFPVLVGHIDKDSGLITASLLDKPKISTAQQMCDVRIEVREIFLLDWNNCPR